jgi:taurine dioxygenase
MAGAGAAGPRCKLMDQRWQVGDLIIWDNRCTMHRRDGFAGQGRRRMHRLMTRGDQPV